MSDDTPSRRADDQPLWLAALKLGATLIALVGAGFTGGMVWGPLADLPSAASTARGEREDMRREIRTLKRRLCEGDAYGTWMACMTVYDGDKTACDREYRSALQSCQK